MDEGAPEAGVAEERGDAEVVAGVEARDIFTPRRGDADDDEDLEPFVQEVRRFYPFFPFVGGRVLRAFDWRGHHFARRTWVLLDLRGTNHYPRLWEEPNEFRPERFRGWAANPFSFMSQGETATTTAIAARASGSRSSS